MRELEQTLRDLGVELAYPSTPDLGPPVAARLARPAPARRRPLRPVALASAALVLLLAATAAALPAARDAILEWVGIRGVEIRVVAEPPDVAPGATLVLGERLPLGEAEERTGLRARLPRGLGRPAATYATGDLLTLRYGRLLLTEVMTATGAFEKQIGPGTRARPVSVRGRTGVYIEGAPHGVRADGGDLRIAGNTLLWSSGGLVLRLEGAASLPEALLVAESVR